MRDAIVGPEPLLVPIPEPVRPSGISRSELHRRMAAGDTLARNLALAR